MSSVEGRLQLRWIAVSVFIVSSTLNYLDRQILATLAPLIMLEMHLRQVQFGLLISSFSLAYAASSLGVGWFLDRAGVNRGIAVAVSWWSAAATATGLVGGLSGLAVCRAALGVGESAGVPAVGKLNGLYLKPEERALGAAVNQIGLSVGLALAPAWIGLAEARGWRIPFVVTGVLGFCWIPVWFWTSRKLPPAYAAQEFQRGGIQGSIWSRNLALLVVANVLWMGSYSLWSNWTVLYLVHVHGLTARQAAGYAWIPPLVSNAGGFFGGWMSLRGMRQGQNAIQARSHAVLVSAAGFLLTLLLPFAANATWATALISASFFFALSGSVNIYALPIDIFGPARAGLAIACLTCAFGLMQTVISPVTGWLMDQHLYGALIWLTTVPLVLGAVTLRQLKS